MTTKKLQIIGGMNADTLDGKHAEEFALVSDIEDINGKLGDTSVSEQIRIHDNSNLAHTQIKEKALCVNDQPYLISGSVNNDLRPHPSVIYGNGKYVSIDLYLYNIHTSVDGINWETSAIVPVQGIYFVGVYGNGKYVFISMNNELGYPIAIYSEDAVNWNYSKIEFTYNDNVISDNGWNKIAFENGLFILSGNAPCIIYSEDAINWQASNEISYNGRICELTNICYGNGKFVTFSKSMFDNILPVFTSTDAITWIVNEIDMNLLDSSVREHIYGFSNEIYSKDIVYGNNMFVAVFTENVTATSVDGVSWNFIANLPCYGVWSFITYRNGTFVAVTNNNALKPMPIVAYSTDCVIWNVADNLGNPLNDGWVALISNEDKFLMTSLWGQCAYSSDGIDWTYAIKSVATLLSEDKTSDLKEVLGVGDPIYTAEESTDTSAEVINADTLGGYSSSDFRHSDWIPTAEEVGARPNNWLPTVAEIGAASVGYGYGEPMIWLGFDTETWSSTDTFQADLEAAFASIPQGTCKQVQFINSSGLNSQKFTGTLWKYTDAYGFLTATNYSGLKAIRTYYSGAWKDWEWENPPMADGVEYRTTMRHNNKPVYVTSVNFGALPANSSKTTQISTSGSKLEIISLDVIATDSSGKEYPFPFINSSGSLLGHVRMGGERTVMIITQADLSTYTGKFIAVYTKE